jgi:hypothetical protein
MLVEKEGVVVNLCLGFKKEGMLINHKSKSYDLGYNGPTSYINCWGDGGCQYELDAIESYWKRNLFKS